VDQGLFHHNVYVSAVDARYLRRVELHPVAELTTALGFTGFNQYFTMFISPSISFVLDSDWSFASTQPLSRSSTDRFFNARPTLSPFSAVWKSSSCFCMERSCRSLAVGSA
jgi:hypothetical protein